MSKKSTPTKLYISKTKMVLAFVIVFVLLESLFYLTINFSEVGAFWPLGKSFYIYTPILVVLSIVFGALSVSKTYYELEDKMLVHHRMGKVIEYSYVNIVYVDEEWSVKHKQLHFYDRNGGEHFLMFDKEGIIYQTVMEKTHLMSREEFKRKYPHAKL